MAETHIVMTFVTVGLGTHASAVAQIKKINEVTVVDSQTHERGWFQRSSLSLPEWDCRIIVRVHDPEDEELLGSQTGELTDPYRMLEYDGTRTLRVPAKLLELSESLHAKCTSVRAARLHFETRRYESEVLDGLVAELEEMSPGRARGTYQRQRGCLFGRIESGVEFVDDLAEHLRRSGLVDLEDLRVDYF